MKNDIKHSTEVTVARPIEPCDVLCPRRHTAIWQTIGHGPKYLEVVNSIESLGAFTMLLKRLSTPNGSMWSRLRCMRSTFAIRSVPTLARFRPTPRYNRAETDHIEPFGLGE